MFSARGAVWNKHKKNTNLFARTPVCVFGSWWNVKSEAHVDLECVYLFPLMYQPVHGLCLPKSCALICPRPLSTQHN